MSKSYVIIVAGASGSGKSTLARLIKDYSQEEEALVVTLDRYYRDQSHLTSSERAKLDYDCWDVLDGERLVKDVTALREGNAPVHLPFYDFGTHTRREADDLVSPAPLVVIEGILALHDPRLRALADDSIFLDIDQDLCYQRRLARDTVERGRSQESVQAQWTATVAPNYERFVLPTRQHAKRIISQQTEDVYRTVIDDVFRCMAMVNKGP
jgi:uridine kinase